MHMKWPIINFIAKSSISNSSDHNPCLSNVSIDVRDVSAAENGDHHQVDDDAPSFSISIEKLAELVEINDVESLAQCGGVQHIASALESNIDTGIVGDVRKIDFRQKAFGFNLDFEGQHNAMTKSFSELVLEAIKDSTIILLLCCASLSLLIEIKRNGLQEGFTDGAIVFLAIFIVVNISLVCRFLKTRLMMKKLQKHKKFVSVVRYEKMEKIPASDVVVGDVVFLEAGNEVPADGLFIDGDSIKLDDGLAKRGPKCTFMFTGAKVVQGNCRMLVTSVGKNTERSKLIGTVTNPRNHEESKLQTSMDTMNSRLEKLWLSLSLIILLMQVLRSFVWKSASYECHNPDPKGLKNAVEEIMEETAKIMKKQDGKVSGLVTVICILVFATRDGLPLGILVLFLWVSKKIKKPFGATVQKLPACATIGLVTTLCIGKTDALSLKHSEMVELWIGLNSIRDVPKEVNSQVLKILQDVVGLHSSCQDSLLFWAKHVLGLDMDDLYRTLAVLDNESFDDKGNRCVSMPTKSEGTSEMLVVHWKGSPEFILSLCSHYYDVDGTMQTLDEEKRYLFHRMVEDVASYGLQCFAFAYKQVTLEVYQSPKLHEEVDQDDDGEKILKFMDHGLTFVGLIRLKNPFAPEVMETFEAFRELGVNIKLVVEDDVNTARVIALNSGILRPEDDTEAAVIEASDFWKCSEEARLNMIDNIRVMANATPTGKLLLVQCLRKKGEVVAITGSCIRDFPSLLEADVGIFMGDHTTEMAKEDADIIVGQNLGKIAAISRLGRNVCNYFETFLQLHLILNISAFTTNFILEVLTDTVQLTSLQLIYTNLIVETLGAFALAIMVEPRNLQLLPGEGTYISTPPINRTGRIITKRMWRNISAQCLFQVTILIVLAMKGKAFFHVDGTVLRTMIFNCYVLCQVFVLIGAMIKRRKTNNFQLGLSICVNYLFLMVLGLIVALQVPLIEIMGVIAHWGKLDFIKWCVCIGIAAMSMPVGYAVK